MVRGVSLIPGIALFGVFLGGFGSEMVFVWVWDDYRIDMRIDIVLDIEDPK